MSWRWDGVLRRHLVLKKHLRSRKSPRKSSGSFGLRGFLNSDTRSLEKQGNVSLECLGSWSYARMPHGLERSLLRVSNPPSSSQSHVEESSGDGFSRTW